jgi:hypothetical protein
VFNTITNSARVVADLQEACGSRAGAPVPGLSLPDTRVTGRSCRCATQNQALAALLFLYRRVLGGDGAAWRPISRQGGALWSCLSPWRGSTGMQPGNGAGTGCFHRPVAGGIHPESSRGASSGSEPCAAGRAGNRAGSGNQQTGHLPHLPPFFRHTPAGSQRYENHHDRYPCAEPRAVWGAKPCRGLRLVCARAKGDFQLAGRSTAILHQHEDLEVVKAQGLGKGSGHGSSEPMPGSG